MVASASSLGAAHVPHAFRADARRPAHPSMGLAPRDRSAAQLARVIEGEIIPRLMLAHIAAHREASEESAIGPRTLEAFARMALTGEASALEAYVETLVEGGVALEDVYLDLLIPVARRLGDDWNEDVISFTDVTVGLSRLQQVVRAFALRLPAGADPGAPSACFATAPGEQHTFGLMLLEDGFRRAGWRTQLDVSARRDTAVEAVADGWFDVFGLSAVSDVEADTLAAAIREVRRASRNPALFVMVGGRVFAEAPGLAASVGADAFCESLASALCIGGEAIKPRAVN